MVVIGSFIQSTELELVLSVLEHHGVPADRIAVIPMHGFESVKASESAKTGTVNEKAFEISIACATALGVVGTSMGFGLKLGPLMWGVIFAFGGMAAAFFISKAIMGRKQRSIIGRKLKKRSNLQPEITVLVQCEKELAEWIGQTMLQYNALAIGAMEEA
jgi:hypothetical protein